MSLPEGAAAAAGEVAEAFHARAGQPGLAYGIVAGGRLAHARGLGEAWLGGPVPDAGTGFRIASMTKSFTAAAVLSLRDEGALALDDPAARYLPELAGSPPVSIRQLLTMTAGLPTDDPWGDRQQGLPAGDFAALLRGGLSFAWAPGTQFEYSNTGYAILGRVITAVTGTAYPEFVSTRLLSPLGLAGTGFQLEDFDAERLARGYRRAGAGWEPVEPDPCGAFAPMGGLFSCVSDLATWVAGLAAAFADGGGRHPLAAASRREMQLPQVTVVPAEPTGLPGDPAGDGVTGYGFGVFAAEDPAWGRIAGHSGGYPGFGSNMRWHPASGLGVVVLANSTYAGASALAARLLDAVLRRAAAPGEPPPPATARGPAGGGWPSPRGGPAGGGGPSPRGDRAGGRRWPRVPGLAAGPWPETLAARQAVTGLLRRWDDDAAARLLAPNVAADEPYPQRRREIELARERIGEFSEHPRRQPEFDSPAHCRWWLLGERGTIQVEILLTPQAPPLVQALRLAVPPGPGSLLARVIDTLVALLNDGAPTWPPSLPASAWLDTGLALRQFRMAAGWAGRCAPGALRAGNGETSATVELDGEHARLVLSVVVDPASQELHQAGIQLCA